MKTIREMKAEIREVEEKAINEVMYALTKASHPITAEELSATTGRVMSGHQVASNLVNIGRTTYARYNDSKKHCSRFTAIAEENGKLETTTKTTVRKFAEVDEGGNPVKNGEVIIREREQKFYALKRR